MEKEIVLNELEKTLSEQFASLYKKRPENLYCNAIDNDCESPEELQRFLDIGTDPEKCVTSENTYNYDPLLGHFIELDPERYEQEHQKKVSKPLQFFDKYLNSKYAHGKDRMIVQNELLKIVKGYYDYRKLEQILEFLEADNIQEIIECSKVDSPSYILTKRLGEGKGGTTYKAYSPTLKQYRVLKVIDQDKVNPKEAELLARLTDIDLENIVRIYDAGNSIVTVNGEKKYCIVMEYVDGHTLAEIILQQPLEPYIVLDYSAQLLNGICHQLEHGIIHRDLNPHNIKVSSKWRLKIIDYGIATDDPNAPPKDNRKNGAPKNLEKENDLFSFGLLVYQMVTGEHLILKKKEWMGSNTYANNVAVMKEKMYKNGKLQEHFETKINNKIDKMNMHFPYEDSDWIYIANVIHREIRNSKIIGEDYAIEGDFSSISSLMKVVPKIYDPEYREDNYNLIKHIIIASLQLKNLDYVMNIYREKKDCEFSEYFKTKEELIEINQRLREELKWPSTQKT